MNRHFESLTCKRMACVQLRFCSVILKNTFFLGTLKCLTCSTHVSPAQCSLMDVTQAPFLALSAPGHLTLTTQLSPQLIGFKP